MDITTAQAAQRLLAAQDVLLIAHKSPDGDTLGSCFALYHALRGLGKRARVECSDAIPEKYGYFLPEEMEAFEPKLLVAVDVADAQLFGKRLSPLAERVDLCIDHHVTNTRYAAETCVDSSKAATAQLVWHLLGRMGCAVTPVIADCLYTGIVTDTGCFRYTSVSPETLRVAAELMERGARAGEINRVMFETKSRPRVLVERRVMETLQYSFGGRCAEIVVSRALLDEAGASEDELDGVSAMPRQIEGVWAAVTYNERDGGYKISMRTDEHVDACEVCAALGGGGHKRAAGCFIKENLAGARRRIHHVLAQWLDEERIGEVDGI